MSPSGDDRNIQKVYIAGKLRFSRGGLPTGMKLGRTLQIFIVGSFRFVSLLTTYTLVAKWSPKLNIHLHK